MPTHFIMRYFNKRTPSFLQQLWKANTHSNI